MNPLAGKSFPSSSSAFKESAITPEQIANQMRDELKRMRKRRQIVPYERFGIGNSGSNSASSPRASPEPMMDDAAAVRAASSVLAAANGTVPAGPSSPTASSSSTLFAKADNKPIFTLKQMTLICQRMCKV